MSIFKNLSMATAGAAFIALGTVGSAQATTLVAPNSLTNVEGNTRFSSLPFAGGSSVSRYQQVYGASEFSSLSGPQYINQISFRPDANSGNPFTSVLPSIQINLSTTKSAPDGLSPTFSENIGANNTVVYNGALPLTSADTGPAGGPKDFDIDINLQTPFLYNPTQGNLLLEVRNSSGGNPTTAFDGELTIGDSISSMFTFGSINAENGSSNSIGLVTQFTTTPAGTTPPPTAPVPPPTTPIPLPTTPVPPPTAPVPPPLPSDPTPIPFEFSPSFGILLLGAWGAIAQLNSFVQKRKSSGSAFSKN